MTLAVLSPAGKDSLKYEIEAASLFEKRMGNLIYVHTDKEKPIPYDAMIVNTKSRKIECLVETKCRHYTFDTLKNKYNMEWLITRDHLLNAYYAAFDLWVPLYGMLYLVPEKTILWIMISDVDGKVHPPIHSKRTFTTATINGGIACKMNSFINMKTAQLIR